MKTHKNNDNSSQAHFNAASSQKNQVKNNTDFGVFLSNARKLKKYSVDEISAHLKIPVSTIIAIEASDKDNLPVPTFTQGYIRAYAKFLEISEEDVLVIYNNAVPRNDGSDLKPRSNLPDEASSQSPLIKTITVFLIIVVIAVIVFGGIQYYQNKAGVLDGEQDAKKQNFTGNSLDSPSRQPLNVKQNAHLVDGELDVSKPENFLVTAENKKAEAAPTAVESSSTPILGKNTAQKKASTNNNIRSVQSENSADAVKKADTIEIFAENGAWLEVRDANKSRLHYNMLPVGGRALLVGDAPFSVIMGNASSTRVEVNGIKIDVTDYTRSNNTANFKVSTQGQDVLFQ